MKIEKISNSQIRCILTGEDLARRQLRLSELAYGTEKARALFRDMMEQAAVQCGFDAENYPLMIEAIPLGSDSIVLIVTKVDNPEELDTRFSNFAPSVKKDALPPQESASPLNQLLKAIKDNGQTAPDAKTAESILNERKELIRRDVIEAARTLACVYTGKSSLYRDEKSRKLYLLLKMKDMEETAAMQSVLVALSEYGTPEKVSPARQQYLISHCSTICKNNALSTLAEL